MTQQPGMELMNIEAKLTAEQVAEEILQAVLQGRHDLTLAPDEDTEKLLQIMQENPDKAEKLKWGRHCSNVCNNLPDWRHNIHEVHTLNSATVIAFHMLNNLHPSS